MTQQSLEEMERELKQIQLQRERLALERELALQNAGGTAKQAARAIGSGITAPFRATGRLVARGWKLMLAVLVVVGSVAGAIALNEMQKRKAEDEALSRQRAKFAAALEDFTLQQCPASTFTCSTAGVEPKDQAIAQYLCAKLDSDRAMCRYRAHQEFSRRNPDWK